MDLMTHYLKIYYQLGLVFAVRNSSQAEVGHRFTLGALKMILLCQVARTLSHRTISLLSPPLPSPVLARHRQGRILPRTASSIRPGI